jgi:hypothetical protein
MKRAPSRRFVPFVSVLSVSCLSVLIVPTSALADEPADHAPSAPSKAGLVSREREPLSPADERRMGEIQRGIGIGTTVAGIAVGTAATGFMVIGLGTGQGQGSLAALGPIVVGSAGAGLGLLLSALGVPLWVSGQARIAHAKERERVSFVPSFTPVAGGGVASLGVSF